MNENKLSIVKTWFIKANNDIKNIENNLDAEEIPTDTLCFHAQQAIEKYFKGVLVYFDQPIIKSHDLVMLLSQVSPFISELGGLEELLEKISDFAVNARYPDTFYEPSLEETKEAYQLALKIRAIILKHLKSVDFN